MLKKIAAYRVVTAMYGASLAFVLGGFLWAFFALRGIGTGPFIIHFDDMLGITQVGGLGPLFGMGIFGLFAVVINFFISIELEERDRFLGKIAAGATLLFAILLFVAFAAIVNVN